jgi:hypothetical protein
MTAQALIMHLLAGGMLGMLGQSIRVVVGLKKANDFSSAANSSLREEFDLGRLLISLLIGFTAGGLAVLGTSLNDPTFAFTSGTVTAIVTAGYAGTDFIEAFMRREAPSAAADAARAPVQAPAGNGTSPTATYSLAGIPVGANEAG